MECFRCGLCCTRCLVYVSLTEARRISDWLEQSWDEFVNRYIEHYHPEALSFQLRHDNGKCIFLGSLETGHMSRCMIQPVKPSACLEWNVSLYQRACQEGLVRYWGLTVTPSGKLNGTEPRLRDFRRFVQSLEPDIVRESQQFR